MTEIKTIFGTYTTFNEIPIHSVFIWGNGLKFIKLSNAIQGVSLSKQPANCFDLQKNHYCTFGSEHKVKVVKRLEDFEKSNDAPTELPLLPVGVTATVDNNSIGWHEVRTDENSKSNTLL